MSLTSLLFHRDRTSSTRRRSRAFRPGVRPGLCPTVEGLESRLVLSAAVQAAPAPAQAPTINVLPQLNFTDVNLDAAGSTVTVVLGNVTQVLDLGLSTTPNPADAACPILNLELGPINLNLLGLNVATSAICLDVTAHEGGGLLGDLLCGLSNALNGLSLDPNALTEFLGGLTSTDLGTLLDGLSGLLTGALGAVTTTGAPGTAGASTLGVSGTSAGACDILNLALGPIDLNLLGLQVELDDCNDGPVTVDITAVPGGGLLGDLLCDLNDLLSNGRATARSINQLLTNIGREIDRLV